MNKVIRPFTTQRIETIRTLLIYETWNEMNNQTALIDKFNIFLQTVT